MSGGSMARARRSPGAGAGRVRRGLVATLLAAGALVALVGLAGLQGCGDSEAADRSAPRMIVLGMDGLDYDLIQTLMAEGRLPNFSRLAREGGFTPLTTSIPPQSPVAWSDFITGLDSGGHGIFDFLHRDPETMLPSFSMGRSVEGEPIADCLFGKLRIPGSGEVELLRHGTPFWAALEDDGVETAILRMPVNFPPSGLASHELSGMGTPDLLGTPGTFSFYTSELFAFSGEELSGGDVYEVDAFDNVVHSALYGPPNPFLCEPAPAEAEFTVYLDPKADVARLVVGDEERILQVGEWSDWVPFEFPLVPTQSVPAMARFHLVQVRPELEMYVSPIQIDPENPALPISHPAGFAAELARATGRFYTQGMPEDTQALSGGVFAVEEFLDQAEVTGKEIRDQYATTLARFDHGLLFYYFGSVDQVSHMMWRTLDPDHPAYDAERDGPHADVIPHLYEQMDEIVGYTLDHMGENATLVVLSDHGFASWRRAFNLNSWLRDHGFLVVKNPDLATEPDLYGNVDWTKTRAYGLGLSGLYINLEGRESRGIVPPAEREALMREIGEELLATIDPATGLDAVTKVYYREEAYHDRGYLEIGPDIQVGYAKTVRGANESALGELTAEVMYDNIEPWSGDHIMDHTAVPGVLFTSRPLARRPESLKDVAGVLLEELGTEGFPRREGGD